MKKPRRFLKILFFAMLFLIRVSPSSAQSFENLLQKLMGSEADQAEDTSPAETPPPLPSSTDILSTLEDEFAPARNTRTNGVVLQGLDKATARVFILEAPLEKQIEFGTLKIVVHRCEKTPAESRQDSMAFVTITEVRPNCAAQKLFSGWMFASSPSLSALDHPLYDVWIKECKNVKRNPSPHPGN